MAKINLSEREQKILNLASSGLIDKEIATALDISLTTVRTYWDRLRSKLSASNRTHALALALPILLEIEREDRRQAEEINRFIVRTIEEVAIFTCAKSGLITSWNLGVERLLGYVEEEWVGQSTNIIFTPEESLDSEPEGEFIEAKEEGVSINDRWHLRKDGTAFWGRNTVIPFRPLFSDPGYAKIVQDRSWESHKAPPLNPQIASAKLKG
ncbi:MAG: PAS domain S-box protein [Chlorobia bacterium]|nr:PAS domain S-box protein [Fimbriimonadaceae bacterium]